jgi:hypothetical protein
MAGWRTVRVFISSTFRDMQAERDHLVTVVFPALRERLEKYRVYPIDIDLRWGVTREQAENDQAIDLCLQQAGACEVFVGILGQRYGWLPAAHPRALLDAYPWVRDHRDKSITELEILHGVLNGGPGRKPALFYFRDQADTNTIPEPIRTEVFVEADADRIGKLADLKERIRAAGLPLLDGYPARWEPQAVRLAGLEVFGERLGRDLWEAIKALLQLPDKPPAEAQPDPLAEELDYHERFMESRLRVYVGRERISRELFSFAEGDEAVACLVTGPSGSGKSAALAHFLTDYRQQHPEALVVPHFVGASPRSTNLREMLRRFCQVLKGRFRFAEEVPEEVARLSVTFREFLGKVPADRRVLLVIDALNQLDETDHGQELFWLPVELPPQVKVIASCITDSGKTEPVLEAFRHRKHCPVQITALSDAERQKIIRQVPSLSAKTLDDEQVLLLLGNPATANPLFLLVALEELRGFGSYERLNERIRSFPQGHRPNLWERVCRSFGLRKAPVNEPDYVTEIFTQVVERLEEEFNKELVATVLTLLASARRGLSERELQELVAGLDGADDLFAVLRQLRPYLLSRAGLIDFYHRNLLKAVRERYLPSEEQQRLAHVCLADYFHGQDYWLESLEDQQRRAKALPPTPRPANVRKVDELPWQLLQAADWQKSEQLLTNLAFLEAKAEAGMVFDLGEDFGDAVGRIPAEHPFHRIVGLLGQALRLDINVIARHPTTLFQCLWNRCWWHDSPEAAGHYDPPTEGWPPEGPPLGAVGAQAMHFDGALVRAEAEAGAELRLVTRAPAACDSPGRKYAAHFPRARELGAFVE